MGNVRVGDGYEYEVRCAFPDQSVELAGDGAIRARSRPVRRGSREDAWAAVYEIVQRPTTKYGVASCPGTATTTSRTSTSTDWVIPACHPFPRDRHDSLPCNPRCAFS